MQVRINRKVKMKSTKTQCYVAEKKFRERYTKIQLRSSSQRSTQLPFESGTSRAISAVAILLCLSFLVSLVLQYWSVRSSKRKGLQETKQELLFHSNQDQFVRGCPLGRCLGTLKAARATQYHCVWYIELFNIKIIPVVWQLFTGIDTVGEFLVGLYFHYLFLKLTTVHTIYINIDPYSLQLYLTMSFDLKKYLKKILLLLRRVFHLQVRSPFQLKRQLVYST